MNREEERYLRESGKLLFEMMQQPMPEFRIDFYLKEGEPVGLPDSSTEQPWLHDSSNITLALKVAQTPVTERPHIGIIFRGRSA
jgi:hypothetical protein